MKCMIMICTVLVFGQAMAESPVAVFAAKQEAAIAERVERESLPLRRLQTEYLQRQDYALRMERERKDAIRSGKLTSPELEKLRAERAELIERLKALDAKIDTASDEAPEMKELQTLMKANQERIATLMDAIMPESLRKTPPQNP